MALAALATGASCDSWSGRHIRVDGIDGDAACVLAAAKETCARGGACAIRTNVASFVFVLPRSMGIDRVRVSLADGVLQIDDEGAWDRVPPEVDAIEHSLIDGAIASCRTGDLPSNVECEPVSPSGTECAAFSSNRAL